MLHDTQGPAAFSWVCAAYFQIPFIFYDPAWRWGSSDEGFCVSTDSPTTTHRNLTSSLNDISDKPEKEQVGLTSNDLEMLFLWGNIFTLLSCSHGYQPTSCSCSGPAATKAVKRGSLCIFYCPLTFDGMQNNRTALGQWSAKTLSRKGTISVIQNGSGRGRIFSMWHFMCSVSWANSAWMLSKVCGCVD